MPVAASRNPWEPPRPYAELRGHGATGGMHLVNHGLPSTERLLAIKTGDVRIIGRRGAIDHRAFGHNQANFPVARRA